MKTCACKCGCYRAREADCDNLCEQCWREWCQASEKHGPVADNSYMGTYGLVNIWTGWLISQAPHVVAGPADALQRYETPPRCPDPLCDRAMVRRPGCWKCYSSAHEEPVVVLEKVELPRSPKITVIRPDMEGS